MQSRSRRVDRSARCGGGLTAAFCLYCAPSSDRVRHTHVPCAFPHSLGRLKTYVQACPKAQPLRIHRRPQPRIAWARYDSVMSTSALQPNVASYDRISIGMLMGGLFLPLAAAGIGPGTASQALSVVALLCWLLLPAGYPFFAIRTGVIGGRYRVFKRQDPVKFCLGLATYEALLLTLSFCIASVLYSTLEQT